MGLKEEILGLPDRKVEAVEVPEWGRQVRVMEMSAADRDVYELDNYLERKANGRAVNVRAKLVARCLVDEAGERVFADADIAALGAKSGKALDRLFDVAQRLNKIGPDEVKALEGN